MALAAGLLGWGPALCGQSVPLSAGKGEVSSLLRKPEKHPLSEAAKEENTGPDLWSSHQQNLSGLYLFV